jgi:preprotein translocase SecE subunit
MRKLLRAPFTYLRGSFQELRRVTWPSLQQIMRMTLGVVLASLLMVAFVGGFDYLLVRYALPLLAR